MFFLNSIFLLCFGILTQAATITYNFNATWVTANPDGLQSRPVMGINGQWPVPRITANVGDRVIVNLQNQLGNATTSLHFHGLYQNGSTEMDGVVGASQCPVGIGELFVYNFTIDQPGTYWYHTHELAQYPDGLRGPLIITDPDSPYKGQYDEERILTVSDWYHDQMSDLLKGFINVVNPTGAEPVPKAALFNDTQNLTTNVEPGKTYMFRIINIGAFAGQYVWFEGHTMQIVEVDGIYTKKAAADMIYITAAQRYSVLITTKNDTSTNFAYSASMDQDLFDTVPASLNPNVTGWLVYNEGGDLPPAAPLASFDPFDDFTLVPTDGEPLLPDPGQTIPLTMKMDDLGDGANYAFFNDITYVRPKVPTIFTALSTGVAASNASIYGVNTNAFVLNKGDVIDIVLNNHDTGKHPFHLHGHAFQAIARSDDDAGDYVGNVGNQSFPAVPMRRDTFMVRPNGNIVLRFVADNPDKIPRIWLFHCHIEWHVASGLVATMVEAPLSLQETLVMPQNHIDACTKQDIPIAGNAAGNTRDLFDLAGANVSPAPLPDGFTARGFVALVFSILSAFLGMGVIAWYGAAEIGTKETKKEEGTREAFGGAETEAEE